MYARCVQGLEPKQRKKFDDELYGFTALNEAGNDVLRDIRAADEAMETTAGGIL